MAGYKKFLLRSFANVLARITKRYIKRFKPKVVVVAGSIGKTSTTQAIASVLGEKYQVRSTIKSYNVAHALPLSVFAEELPTSKFGWLTLLPRIAKRARSKQPFDVLVLEIGTDHPGELQQFAYLKPQLGVITAVTPEHMEYFKTMDAVAAEELSIATFCERTLISHDMVAEKYRHHIAIGSRVAYFGQGQTYQLTGSIRTGHTLAASLLLDQLALNDIATNFLGGQSLYAVLAAASVASEMGLDEQQIRTGIGKLQPVGGRMCLLKGIDDSTIIDDSYNASPEAVIAALNTLDELPGTHKIALLGSMNELGETSEREHKKVGLHCDPDQLDLVITLGKDANEYLAQAAKVSGCNVLSTDSPHTAAQLIKDHLKPDTLILVKGSQNGVYAEEAIKELLADPADSVKLVRQSPYWLGVKRRQFPDMPA